ncbi:DUF4386 domain-containing protein [Metabacillus litoralis]|uniref:DUF4386 domain-containing protein n=1 Tax=Metabacillus litoralis TaxID=152268 RepID=UPI00203F4379|nr:DUF4386 domain-containing protein [Metabacillus litoralis]MCM3165139.1 DUF4386 domain-containing protein [Metabacillus litoralis]
MTQDKINAKILGAFYIVAAISSVIAVILYGPVLSEQGYMDVTNGVESRVLIGVINDLLLVVSVVGTAIMLFPYIRRFNEHIALGYLCFRFMEAVFISIGMISILGLLSISMNNGNTGSSENLFAVGSMLQAFYRWTALLGPNLMLGLNTFLYSYLLLKTNLVPRQLAIFGMITAILVFIAGLLEMFGLVEPFSAVKGFIALPVGVYEMSLAVWLIVKGFDKQRFVQLKEATFNKIK